MKVEKRYRVNYKTNIFMEVNMEQVNEYLKKD